MKMEKAIDLYQFCGHSMQRTYRLLLTLVFCIIICTKSVVSEKKCAERSGPNAHCQCFADGFVVDLKPILDSATSVPLFKDRPATTGTDKSLYSYQPCSPFAEPAEGTPTSKCEHVSICQKVDDNSYYNAGTEESGKFIWNSDKNNFNVTYTGQDGRTSVVMLQCRNGVTADLTVYGETKTGSKIYEFMLATKHACPTGGLSTGSILCIIFFVGVFLYLVLGFLIMRFGRGARGLEQIPNYEFWLDFPSLVKDGFMFTIKGCKVESGYSQI